MGVEILASDFFSGPVEDATEQDKAVLSDVDKNVKLTDGLDLKEPIKFGLVDSTHGTDGHSKAERDHAKNVNFPKDAVDECPEPKHTNTAEVEIMGTEILAADFFSGPVEDATEQDKAVLSDVDKNVKLTERLDLKEPIKFGLVDSTHGTNGHSKAEGDHAENVNFLKDAVDECSEPKHTNAAEVEIMGTEILAADFFSGPVEDATEQDKAVLSDVDKNVKLTEGLDLKEPIKFGLVDSTHGTNGHSKAERDNAENVNFLKDAVDECPEPKHTNTAEVEIMGTEILAADFIFGPVKVVTELDKSISSDVDNDEKLTEGLDLKEPIKFGSVDCIQGTDGHAKEEVDNVKSVNLPKDAVDEWPEPKRIFTFYFVRYQPYEDSKIKAKLEQVDKEIQKQNEERFQITEALKTKRSERSHVISQLKPLTAEDKQYREIIDGKRKEMEPLQAALGKLRNVNNAERGMGICSSEEELDSLIQSFNYRIQHESNTLSEEKQLLKDIRHLAGTRQKVVANAAMRAQLQNSLRPKEAIQDQVKLLGVDLDGIRKEQQAVRAKIRNLQEQLKFINDKINSMHEDLTTVNQKKDKAFESLNELRKSHDEGNACYYQNRALLNNARDLAAKRNIAALKELSHDEVEKFMSQWSGDKSFRDDYERRISPSLNRRQLSRDGTLRNPDEKPIIVEAVTSVEVETSTVKGDMKYPNGNVDAAAQPASSQEVPKDDGKKLAVTETKGKTSTEESENYLQSERNEFSAAPEIDAAKLKQMKREEEIAKAKSAMERKKKLAEKAAAKAAAWAQKEAERKLKEREKRARKKAGPSVPDNTEEPTEVPQEAEEVKDAQVPFTAKEQKENVRSRIRSKGRNQLPKPILQRKKSPSYRLWAASVVILALILVIVAYNLSFGRN